ncbi:MAG: universal stress protein [Alphaproteobacteria bacterium]|nr:MAG: universal stress protein [Alphaproteobacteria bacterium]
MGEGLTADAIQDLVDAAEREGRARAAKSQAIFESAREAAGVASGDGIDGGETASASWEEAVGFVADRAGRAARLADLTILAQPGEGSADEGGELLNEVLFRSGRPLLMVPAGATADTGAHVIVSWNGRAECARTVAAALPLLKTAQRVTLLHVGEEHPDRPGLEALRIYLARHGIESEAVRREAEGVSVADAILAAMQDCGGDMLVMGAYSHSRWREMILGGVTRHAIQHAAVPVLMSH